MDLHKQSTEKLIRYNKVVPILAVLISFMGESLVLYGYAKSLQVYIMSKMIRATAAGPSAI